jgi:acyl carrier protein
MTTKLLTKEKIQEELVEFLCLQFYVDKEDIDLNESLVDTGIIDSMGLIEISAYITEKYSFSISTVQMTKDNFGSVEKITSFILSNINQK